MFSCEICEIFKNTFFYVFLRVYFILLRVFRFFLFLSFFLIFLWILPLFGFEVRFLSEVSRGELVQPHLVISLLGLVQFEKNLYLTSTCLLELVAAEYLRQFLYLVNGYLFFRCLEKIFEEERNENKKGHSRSV